MSTSSGVLNAVGYTLQKRSIAGAYLRSPLWWTGLALLLGAETLSGVALTLLPASVVVALNSLSVLFSALLASATEPCRVGLVLATANVVSGGALLGLSVPDDPSSQQGVFEALASVESLVYHACAGVACAAIHVWRRDRIVYLATYAGLVSSVTAAWYRPLVVLVLDGRYDLLRTSPIPYVSVLVLVTTGPYAAAYLEARGLRLFPQSEWIPVHFVACLVWFSVSAEVIFGDWQSLTFTSRMWLFVPVAFVNILLGVVAVSRRW